MNHVFITYNPKSDTEQVLAVRMHTLGAVHGIRMYLPDRTYNETLSEETKTKIQKSDWMIYFSISPLSPQVKAEIEYAYECFKDKTKIIVVYDSIKGKNLTGKITEHFSSFYFDSSKRKADEITSDIMSKIRNESFKSLGSDSEKKDQKSENSLLTLLGIGAGLFLLGTVLKDDEKPRKRK